MVEYNKFDFNAFIKTVGKPVLIIFITAVVVIVGVLVAYRVAQRVVFLFDLRYFHRVMQENFDLYDVAYRVRGTDIDATVRAMGREIARNPDICVDEFFALLSRNFCSSTLGGHFGFITPARYQAMMDSFDDYAWWFFPSSSLARLSYSRVESHYLLRQPSWTGQLWLNGSWMADERHFIYRTEHTSDVAQQRTIADFALFDRELAEIYATAIENNDLSLAFQAANQLHEIINSTPNVITKSIEEGRIAYLSINNFSAWSSNDPNLPEIWEFYRNIHEYEHLIIDIRKNPGGSKQYFIEAVIRPLISEPMESNALVFMNIGAYNEEFVGNFYYGRRFDPISPYHLIDGGVHPVDEILADPRFDLRYLYMSDMERMEYGFRMSHTIYPLQFTFYPSFEGKIWLLIGSSSASAAEYAARISKNSGFATLVGERTAGILNGSRIFVSLPYTGILFQMDLFYVTDQYGRPWDAGTYPHHFNRPGLDALETTLQLIAEGNY